MNSTILKAIGELADELGLPEDVRGDFVDVIEDFKSGKVRAFRRLVKRYDRKKRKLRSARVPSLETYKSLKEFDFANSPEPLSVCTVRRFVRAYDRLKRDGRIDITQESEARAATARRLIRGKKPVKIEHN
jgi:hypothetical protein